MKLDHICVLASALTVASLEKMAFKDKCIALDILDAVQPEYNKWKPIETKAYEEMRVNPRELDKFLTERLEEDIQIKIPEKMSKAAFEAFVESNPKISLGWLKVIRDTIVKDE